MKLLSRRPETAAEPGVSGVARLDRRTDSLARRLRPGDIAVLDHIDLDRASAEALVACQVGAVVNAAESISGRYPNRGPQVLAAAGVLLVDAVGSDVFGALRDGQRIRVHEGMVWVDDRCVASGEVLDASRVTELTHAARSGLAAQTAAFTASAMHSLEHDRDLLLEGVGVPGLRTPIDGRHALVVAAGQDSSTQLAELRQYVRENRPVLIGVDGGADLLRDGGYRPDLVVGDADLVSDAALRSAREVVAHSRPDRRDVGQSRLERLGVASTPFISTGTSEDAALLLADCAGASLIVAIGTRTSLVDFLDTDRPGSTSTFLTRLRVGAKLVDGAAVSQLHASRLRTWPLLLLLVAGLLAVTAALAVTPVGAHWVDAAMSWATATYDSTAASLSHFSRDGAS